MKKSRLLLFGVILLLAIAVGNEIYKYIEKKTIIEKQEQTVLEEEEKIEKEKEQEKDRIKEDSIRREQAKIDEQNRIIEAGRQYDREHQHNFYVDDINKALTEYNNTISENGYKGHGNDCKFITEDGEIEINDYYYTMRFNIKDVTFNEYQEATEGFIFDGGDRASRAYFSCKSDKECITLTDVRDVGYSTNYKRKRSSTGIYLYNKTHQEKVKKAIDAYRNFIIYPNDKPVRYRSDDEITSGGYDQEL